MKHKNQRNAIKQYANNYYFAEAIERRLLMSTYTVNTLSDAINPGSGLLTLRQAVADANAHSGADTIAFLSKTFRAGSLHTIMLTQGQINITSGPTTITGPGESVLAINGKKASRIFQISSAVTVAISGMTITNGKETVDQNGATQGGGIYSNGNLTLSDSIITGNSVLASGYTYDPYYQQYVPSEALGGGISSYGPLTINNCTISGNSSKCQPPTAIADKSSAANAWGGGISESGILNLSGDTIVDNTVIGGGATYSGGQAAGGGLAINTGAPATVTSCTISGNSAVGLNAANKGGSAFGGGISGSETPLNISNSTIDNNSATGGTATQPYGGPLASPGTAVGGGLEDFGILTISNSQVNSNSAISHSGYNAGDGGQGGGIDAGNDSATISDSSINDNTATGDGGGLAFGGGVTDTAVLNLEKSTVSGNTILATTADDGYDNRGGGIDTGTVTVIDDSSITSNSIKGGLAAPTSEAPLPGKSVFGGGIYSDDTLTVTNSTVADNTLTGGAGNAASQLNGEDAFGAGICSRAPQILASSVGVTIQDSTITGNAAYGGSGGPAYINYAGKLAGKNGTADGGGIYAPFGTLVDNSIISANNAASGADVFSSLSSSSSHNLIGYGGGLTNGVNGNLVGIHNPELTPLSSFGGPTETMIPLSGSPAIGAGSASLVPSGITTDQRGYPRTTTAKSLDIGAVQFGSARISGIVFNDLNATGTHQSSDPGIPGFTVYLDLNHNGKLDSTDISAITSSIGGYSFVDVPAGTFAVNIVGQSAYRLTTPNNLPISSTVATGASAAGPAFGETQDALISGIVNNTVTKALLSGWRVYIDSNDDGKWGSTEPSAVTTSNGTWSFNIASPGTYEIRIVPMSKYKTTAPTGNMFTFTVGKASARIGNFFSERAIG